MVVSDDDGPDFVDELEAELAARRPVPVQQDELQITPNKSKDLESLSEQMVRQFATPDAHCQHGHRLDGACPYCPAQQYVYTSGIERCGVCHGPLSASLPHECAPVQQDEPEGDEYPRKDGDVLVLGPECIAAEDGSAIIWKGEHYSRSLQDFASDGEGSSADPGSPPARQTAAGSQPSPVPVQQDEPEGVCAFPNCSCTENGCPGVGGEPCRGCGVPTGVGAYHHIGCRTPEPNPVPVQQDEPEGLMCSSYSGRPTNERCTKDAGHGGLHEGEMLRWSDGPRPLLPGCKTCGAATGETCHKDCPQQIAGGDTMTVPSVGQQEPERSRFVIDVPYGYDLDCINELLEGVVDLRLVELQVSPNESKDLESGPVQQDEPEGVPPEAAPLPRSRPPRSHRDDESLRRWEARHPSVRFRPTVPLEQEPERCEHDWVVETRTASIKVCQSCGMEQAKNMDDAVVGLCAAVPSVGLNNDGQDGELLKDSVSGVSSVPSVGLRDRLAEAIWEQQEIQVVRERSIPWAEINRRDCQDREWTYEMADAALSVLYEAGGEVDEGKGYDLREAGAFNTFHIIATDLLDNLPDGWALVRAVPAEAGTQEDEREQAKVLKGRLIQAVHKEVEAMVRSHRFMGGPDPDWRNSAIQRRLVDVVMDAWPAPAVSGTPDTGER